MIELLFEELFPSVKYFFNRRKLSKKIEGKNFENSLIDSYIQLDTTTLKNRLSEEHTRGVKIDEKTFKFTLGLSVSLTIIAAASGSFAKFFSGQDYSSLITIICGVSALYMLSAGIVSLGAIKTLPTFGYGTHHEIELKNKGDDYLVIALISQEKVNIIRQLRNEAAFQSLRNGFVILFLALLLSVIFLMLPYITSFFDSVCGAR